MAFGLSGRTFAIPTMNASISKKLKLEKIQMYIDKFIAFAKTKPKLIFLVTEIGCGLAGYNHKDIALLFEDAINVENIYLPEKFWRKLNVKNRINK